MFSFTLQEEDKKKVKKYSRSVKIMARVLIIVK
jgi:hypothetical protein